MRELIRKNKYDILINPGIPNGVYINDLLKDLPNADKFSAIAKSFYEKSVNDGNGELLISELSSIYSTLFGYLNSF